MIEIGIDVEEVNRFKEMQETFINKVFTQNEKKYCNSKALPAQSYAGKFAAKEATMKAINFENLSFLEIEVTNEKSGKPTIKITNEKIAKEIDWIKTSISHTKEIAIAIVMVSKKEDTKNRK